MAELNTLGSVIKSTYEGESNTNAFTDSFKASVEELSLTSSIIAISSTAVTNSKAGSIAVGDGATTEGQFHTPTTTNPTDMIAMGTDALAINKASIAIGLRAKAGKTYGGEPQLYHMGATAIGMDAEATGRFSVVIGRLASDQGAENATIIGDQAGSTKGAGGKSVVIGNDAGAGERGVSIGDTADAGSFGIVLGAGLATSNGTNYGQAYGYGASCTHDYSIAFGKGAETTATSQMMIGGTTGADVLDVVINGDLTVNGSSNITANISVEDEGTEVASSGTINFVGSGVTVTDVGGVPTVTIGGGGSTAWGDVTGTLSDQTDLQSALDAKQDTITDSDDITEGSTNLYMTTSERSKLSGIEASADVTDTANVTSAGAFMTATNDSDDITEGSTNLFFTSAEQSKLSGIEAGADVTDSTNVLSSLTGQSLAVATINTGQGAVECYAMNQDVETTDNVEFASVVAPVVLNEQTGTTYTLVLTDACKHVDLENASATTVTVPPNSSVAFAVGTRISFAQMGAGQITFAQGSGVTIRTPETLKLRSQYSAAVLTKLATNEWLLTGDLEASA